MRLVTNDGVRLHVEVTGSGHDVLFLHEFSGDHRSWESQVRFFSRRYRCVTYAARGFPPSSVPESEAYYSQERAVEDALAVLDHVNSKGAHIVGLSMGGFTALHLALSRPERVSAAVVAGCGYGANGDPAAFRRESAEMASIIQDRGCGHLANLTASSPYRRAFEAKDPRGFRNWKRGLQKRDATGLANTLRGVQASRPTLPETVPHLRRLRRPLLLLVGDEDDPCLHANIAAKQAAPSSGLAVLPKTAHTVNLEEPDLFNRTLLDFFSWVECERWPWRDPRSQPDSGGWIR